MVIGLQLYLAGVRGRSRPLRIVGATLLLGCPLALVLLAYSVSTGG
jgi:hypothetical protein